MTTATLVSLLVIGCGGPDSRPVDRGNGLVEATEPTTTACAATEQVQVYLDSDGDGRGDPATARWDCEPAAGEVLEAGDCNDGEPTAWTGAIDAPCDGVDNDCDGMTPQCVRSMADGDAYLEGFHEDRHIGNGALFVGDMDGDNVEDVIINGTSEVSLGETYLVSGADLLGASGPIEPYVAASWTDPTGQWFPSMMVIPTGDLTGDGLDDVWMGYPVELIAGGVTGQHGRSASPATIDVPLYYGTITGSGADVNGDGIPDVTLHDGRQDAFVFHGPFDGHHSADEAVLHIEVDPGFNVTNALDVQDVNGDGAAEILFGTDCEGGVGSGEGELYFGALPGDQTGDFEMVGSTPFKRGLFDFWIDCEGLYDFDEGARVIGDFNGDGHADLAAAGHTETYVIPGPLSGKLDVGEDAMLTVRHDHGVRAIPESLGDLDGDGRVELVTLDSGDLPGLEAGDARRDGALFVVRGGRSGSISTWDTDAVYHGQPSDDWQGMHLTTGGDVDGDGLRDLMVSTGQSYDPFVSHAGHVYLLTGATLLRDLL